MTIPPSSPSAPHPAAPNNGGDPSMEDILASIRRILSEDEAEAAPPSGSAEVLPLDPSMLVDEPPEPSGTAARVEKPMPVRSMPEEPPTMIAPTPAPAAAPVSAPPAPPKPQSYELLAPEAAAAASSSVGSLLRTLASERQQVAVRAGGPTIEELVREEIRPLLKTWLDTNLPPLVERLVRGEIERVVGRALS